MLKDKKIILTGGASGIGAKLVATSLKEGARVAAIDCKTANLPKEALFFKGDVSNGEDIEQFFLKVVDFFGTPDAVVCCAGQGIHQRLDEGDPDLWQKILNAHIMGVLRPIRAFVPQMLQQRRGDIVLISSIAALQPYPCGGIYAAGKAAVESIARTLRMECRPYIKVAIIRPGLVDTPFFKNIVDGAQTVDSIGWGAISDVEIVRNIVHCLMLN